MEVVELVKGKKYKLYLGKSRGTLSAEYVGKENWNDRFLYIFTYGDGNEVFYPHWFEEEFRIIE